MGFPDGSTGKESACNAGDIGDRGSIPRSGKYPRGGNGNPLQCSCLENPRDGGAWWAAVHGVAQSRTRLKRLSSSSSSNEALTYELFHLSKLLHMLNNCRMVDLEFFDNFSCCHKRIGLHDCSQLFVVNF